MRPKFNTLPWWRPFVTCSALGSRARWLTHALGQCLLLLVLTGCQVPGLAVEKEITVLNESFDATQPSAFRNALLAHEHIDLVEGEGVAGSNAIRVRYQGNPRGSERVLVNYPLPPAEQYSLGFAVRFCAGFDFARGGKLHGLGPSRPVAGGNPVTPARWSARTMFRKEGGLQSYVYSQNKQSRYGEVVIAESFHFQPDRYYRVVMQLQLNEPERDNGFLRILVDGEPLVEHRNIRFRSVSAQETWISTLMFNTFHGGQTPEWAPRTVTGDYAQTCAYFDDFVAAPLIGH